MLGGELLCHRLSDDVDVAGHLPVGAYNQPPGPASLPVGAALGVEAVARVPAKAAVELLGPVVVILVDLPLTVVDDRAGLAGAVLCVLVAGRERILTSARDFLLARGPTPLRPRPLGMISGKMRYRAFSALSGGGPGFQERGNPISIYHQPKPLKEKNRKQ